MSTHILGPQRALNDAKPYDIAQFMVDFLANVDSDNGPKEPTPVTLVSAGKEVAMGGRSNIAATQSAVTAVASQIAPARAGRDSVMVTNMGTVDVFLGPSGVTATTGDLLPGVKGAVKSYPLAGALFAVTASGASNVSVADIY